ncbi:LuxR family transcriptional regulator [uncultured Agrobacterium sp.]|uniref:LuxR family transcriptional regulator n=1 Tax=uncultured Agrobacterium sp. TaxID=157277 RepID=UPI0025861A46|nr:LuxR family transcriptional regulator [uncultured Agrobacterium sp.]
MGLGNIAITPGSVHARIESAQSLQDAITAFRDAYKPVAHATYHHAQTIQIDLGVDAPFVRTTYPDRWIARYLLKGYVKVDPIVGEGLSRSLPFYWSELEASKASADLFDDFQAFGFGLDGYSIPIIDKVGRRALLSFNASLGGSDWDNYVVEHRQDWMDLAHVLHRRAIIELYGKRDPVPQMSPRELETLYWIGQGKDAADIALILKISEFTVRTYMRSVRFKLDCSNLPQAVAKAVTLRLIKA